MPSLSMATTSPWGSSALRSLSVITLTLPLVAAAPLSSSRAEAAPMATAASQTPTRAQLHARQVVAKRTSLVKVAASKKGLPYRWGGTSPTRGFDCSGFTQWVYKKNGINIPRTTGTQVSKGIAVSLKNSQPGDLVFTGSGRRISHVGIIAGAGGKAMWHSPRTGRSISLDSLRYYKVHKVVRMVR